MSVQSRPLRIGIVANEPSGDLLGARLIRDVLALRPDTEFHGVGGPQMIEQGCRSLLPMERLSVMGITEIVRHLPELLGIRARLVRHFRDDPPDLFIGIDAPGFNLGLSARLRRAGICTVQYVSPTVWAWRERRVKGLRRSVDLVLSIYPFEEQFLREHGVPVAYVGHPLAAELPLKPDRAGARQRLNIPESDTQIAVLPGSRVSEMQNLAPDFIEAVRLCLERRPELRFAVPLVNARVRTLFEQALAAAQPAPAMRLMDGGSRELMAAADLVLTASGTATLEALLMKRPMVIAYRVSNLTYSIIKGLDLVKIPYVGMSNLLAGEKLAPEFIQRDCQPLALADALLGFLDDPQRMRTVRERYCEVHEALRAGSAVPAARAVLDLIDSNQKPTNKV